MSPVRRSRLLSLLAELDDFLARHEVRYDVTVHQLRLEVAGEEGPEVSDGLRAKVRSMFGGMGSLTDVWITRYNGHRVDDEAEANRRLQEIESALYDEVTSNGEE